MTESSVYVMMLYKNFAAYNEEEYLVDIFSSSEKATDYCDRLGCVLCGHDAEHFTESTDIYRATKFTELNGDLFIPLYDLDTSRIAILNWELK